MDSSAAELTDATQSPGVHVLQAAAATAAVMQPPTRIPVSTKLPRRPTTGKTVAWVLPGWKAALKLTKTMEAAAAPLGWEIYTIGFDVREPETVNAAVEEAVSREVDYIVVLTAPSSRFGPALAKAKAAGIPVVLYAVVTEPEAVDRGIIGGFSCSYSSIRVGVTFANFIISDSQGAGHGAFIDLAEQPALHETAQAFIEHMNSLCGGGHGSVIPTSHAAVAAGTVGTQVVEFLQANPEVGYVVVPADGIVDDLPSLLEEAGLNKRVKILHGVAPTVADLEKVADGTIYAALEYAGEPNYWLLMYGLAAHSVGLPQFLATDGPTTDLEFVLWTTETIPRPVSKWTGQPNFQQQYLALLGFEPSEPGK